jgi:hypothetical protein
MFRLALLETPNPLALMFAAIGPTWPARRLAENRNPFDVLTSQPIRAGPIFAPKLVPTPQGTGRARLNATDVVASCGMN